MYNPNDPLKIAKDALNSAIETEKRNRKLLESIGPAIIQALSPLFSQLQTAISKLKVDVAPIVQVNPEIKIPQITVPTPQYTPPDVIVNYTPPKIEVPIPKIDLSSLKIPELKWPKGEMPVTGKVSLSNIDINNPLPVQIRDAKGNPISLGGGGVIMGGGGPAGGFVVVKDIQTSSGASVIDQEDGAVKVSGNLTATLSLPSGPGDGSVATRIIQAGDTVSSVNILQIAGNPAVVGTGYQDNALRVVHATDAELSAAAHLHAIDSTGAWEQVRMAGFDSLGALRVANATDAVTSVNVVSSVAVAVSGITNSVSASLVDSTGVAYEGANPLPITIVSGALTSTLVVGDSADRSADNGGNSVKIGGIARQTNPAAFADGDRAGFSSDDLGRQIIRPVQVRDLTVTAYASFTTGTEATLLSGIAGKYLDLIYVLASNNSTVAVGIDIRPSTAGSIVMHLEIPANGTVGVAAPVPIPQQATGDGTGGSWTVDLPDITGTTVYVSALFSTEV